MKIKSYIELSRLYLNYLEAIDLEDTQKGLLRIDTLLVDYKLSITNIQLDLQPLLFKYHDIMQRKLRLKKALIFAMNAVVESDKIIEGIKETQELNELLNPLNITLSC